jgi:hypothetical protein
MERPLAIALEVVGCCIVLTAIIIEIITGAGIGHILATCGAWVVAVGGLIWAKVIRH